MQQLLQANITTYATQKNQHYSQATSHVVGIAERWASTIASLPSFYQSLVEQTLASAIAGFKSRHPDAKGLDDFPLAKAAELYMNLCSIDTTLQRELDVFWVLRILSQFCATMVMPINAYQDPKTKKWCIWDGQHTMMVMWLIATEIYKQNPKNVIVPACLYDISQRAQIRQNFTTLNSPAGKMTLDAIDHWQQSLFGVRIDGSTDPAWLNVDAKQKVIESRGLFVTAKKFGDTGENGAISRLQEINSLTINAVDNLMAYLSQVGADERPVYEKEMMTMGQFFKRCAQDNIQVDTSYIQDIADVILNHWGADFRPESNFWTDVRDSYNNWYNHTNLGSMSMPRYKKEWVHGGPFLIAQLRKDCPHLHIPGSGSNSEFQPLAADLR
jgi:hypothetical protein|tara:strand:- start:1076 stop:2230 length:1155 start_codon:yes stop_codon:yes gene_type:complete